jgi:hypothetical protein
VPTSIAMTNDRDRPLYGFRVSAWFFMLGYHDGYNTRSSARLGLGLRISPALCPLLHSSPLPFDL